jgi:hypothetical protein
MRKSKSVEIFPIPHPLYRGMQFQPKVFSMRFDGVLLNIADDVAKSEGRSRSNFIRHALLKYLEMLYPKSYIRYLKSLEIRAIEDRLGEYGVPLDLNTEEKKQWLMNG